MRAGSRVAFVRNWAIPIIVADFALVPMFHIGSIPWKPGYLTILLASLVYARSLPRREVMASLQIFAVMAILIAVTLVGGLIFDLRTASSGVPLLSLRPLLIYALGALAFFVGTADRRDRHDYLILIIGGFFFVNLIHNALAADWSWLADFYNTKELGQFETYGRDVRVPGVMNNPNLTASMATILLIFVVTGFRSGFVRPSRRTATAIVAMSGALVVVMLSRNQLLAIVIVAGAGISYLPRRMVLTVSLSVILVGVVSWWALTIIGDDRQNQLLGLKLTESFGGRWASAGIGRTNVIVPISTELSTPPQGEAVSPPPDSIDESPPEIPTLDVPGESDVSEAAIGTPESVGGSETTNVIGTTPDGSAISVPTGIINGALFREDGLARPLKNWRLSYDRWAISPIFGTGYQGSPKFPTPSYHNDWLTVFAASGLVGMAAFAFLGLKLVRIDPLLGVPLLLPGLTNAFLTAPQHFVLLMLLAGLIVSRRWGPKTRDVGNPAPAAVGN
jgi:hypothetical protein